jgi:hypothetical protein
VNTHVICADRWIVNIEVRVILGEALWVCLCMCPVLVAVGEEDSMFLFQIALECQSDENRGAMCRVGVVLASGSLCPS